MASCQCISDSSLAPSISTMNVPDNGSVIFLLSQIHTLPAKKSIPVTKISFVYYGKTDQQIHLPWRNRNMICAFFDMMCVIFSVMLTQFKALPGADFCYYDNTWLVNFLLNKKAFQQECQLYVLCWPPDVSTSWRAVQ